MKTTNIKFIVPLIAITLTSCINTKGETVAGYIKVDDVTMVSSDFNNAYAPSKGDVKMLVVPISFVDDAKDGDQTKYQDWTDAKITSMNEFYFGETNSLTSYYKTASLDQLHVSGKVTAIYENSTIKASRILSSMYYLFNLIEEAVSWIQDNDETINWSEYDLNQDGCIDNIHLITNYVSTDWGNSLWPHMSSAHRAGTLERPGVNVYSISSTGFVVNPITAIHEQGHIFGLDDYYDYTDQDQGIDYIGGLDMQSHNVFDWNSFSKLCMGWVKPYVVNGEAKKTTITIKAASLNGDCILVPADYSTWNGSAFDEYFLIELFAPYGNNKKDWKKYIGSLGFSPGLRVYHVDARMFGSNEFDPYTGRIKVSNLKTQQINSLEEIANWDNNSKGANNSVNYLSYGKGIQNLKDKPQLSIVQRGGTFTFAQPNGRHSLSAGDLFRQDHEFTFSKYSCFLNKQGKPQSLTNKGEEFPYTFVVDYMDKETATITFTKVK